jgi:hypothetical protein
MNTRKHAPLTFVRRIEMVKLTLSQVSVPFGNRILGMIVTRKGQGVHAMKKKQVPWRPDRFCVK